MAHHEADGLNDAAVACKNFVSAETHLRHIDMKKPKATDKEWNDALRRMDQARDAVRLIGLRYQ